MTFGVAPTLNNSNPRAAGQLPHLDGTASAIAGAVGYAYAWSEPDGDDRARTASDRFR